MCIFLKRFNSLEEGFVASWVDAWPFSQEP